MICRSLKCNVIYILRNKKNSGIINTFGITRVECEVIYNKFEVIRIWNSTLWSPSSNYCCTRYRVTNFNNSVYKNETGVPNVTTVTNVPKITKNDSSVLVLSSVHFYMGFWKNPLSVPYNSRWRTAAMLKIVLGRIPTAFWASTIDGFRIVSDTLVFIIFEARNFAHFSVFNDIHTLSTTL